MIRQSLLFPKSDIFGDVTKFGRTESEDDIIVSDKAIAIVAKNILVFLSVKEVEQIALSLAVLEAWLFAVFDPQECKTSFCLLDKIFCRNLLSYKLPRYLNNFESDLSSSGLYFCSSKVKFTSNSKIFASRHLVPLHILISMTCPIQ